MGKARGTQETVFFFDFWQFRCKFFVGSDFGLLVLGRLSKIWATFLGFSFENSLIALY
jgi:hypothetical protein